MDIFHVLCKCVVRQRIHVHATVLEVFVSTVPSYLAVTCLVSVPSEQHLIVLRISFGKAGLLPRLCCLLPGFLLIAVVLIWFQTSRST